MDDTPKDKKGFAGFDSLASDIDVDMPEPIELPKVEALKAETPPKWKSSTNTDSKSSKKTKDKFYKNILEKMPKVNWGALIIIGIVAVGILSDTNKKKPSASPTPSYSAKSSAVDSQISNYHPRITPYIHSDIFEKFVEEINSKKKFTKASYKKYEAESRKGNIDAQFIVSVLLKYGLGIKKEEKTGNIIMIIAAQNGQPDALRNVALESTGDDQLNYMMRAALLGDDKAQYEVGEYYYSGHRITADNNKALFWFQKAAEQYNADAQLALSRMYFKGAGVAQDRKKAINWLLKAALQYNPTACAAIAADFVDKKDYGTAYYYWSSCSDMKNEQAKSLAADIEPNLKFSDYITAAQLGLRPAMLKLAKDYHEGLIVLKNNIEAQKWLRMHGYADDQSIAAMQKEILAEMTPEEITQANDKGDAWVQSMVSEVLAAAEEKKQAIAAAKNPTPYLDESQPSIGSAPTLTLKELRWCIYQGKRLDYINHQVPKDEKDTDAFAKANVQYITQEVVNKNDALIAYVRQRCPAGRNYYEKDMDIINSEMKDPIYRNQIALESQKIMLGWDQHFWFRD